MMTDISKCNGGNCPVKNDCYRYTAIADPNWQSYMFPVPYKINELKFDCDFFVGEYVIVKELNETIQLPKPKTIKL